MVDIKLFSSLYSIEAINGVGFLLSMLETKVKSLKTQAELSAAERVQKKSAIALSRYVFEVFSILRSGSKKGPTVRN